MSDSQVKVTITADAGGAVAGFNTVGSRLKQFNTETAGMVKNIQSHWMGLTAAIAGVAIAMNKAWSIMEKAADYQERVNSIAALGAQYEKTGTQIVKMTQDASRGLISMAEAADMSAKALNLSLNPKQISEYTAVAEQLTDVIGGSIPEAFDRMIIAAATGRTMTLAQMGVIVDLESIYVRYAESVGKSKDALTEYEKQQARINGILDVAKSKTEGLGPAVDTTRDKMDRLKVTVTDLELVMGQLMIRGLAGVAGTFQIVAAAALKVSQGIFKIVQGYNALMGMVAMSGSLGEVWHKETAAEYKLNADAAGGAAADLWAQAKDNFSAMASSQEEMASVIKKTLDEKVTVPTEKAAGATDKLLDRWKEMETTLKGEISKSGLDDFERRLIDIDTRAEILKERFAGLPADIRAAAFATIESFRDAQVDDLTTQAAQRDFDNFQKNEEERRRLLDERYYAELAFYAELGTETDRLHELRLEQIEREAQAWRDAGIDRIEVEKWVHAETVKLNTERAQSNIGHIKNALGYTADMFESLSQLYDKDSSERKKLHDLSMAFNLAEKAATTAQIILEATKAVATQGSGDPYTAFARVAAMAASMAALLASVGIAFSGSGGGSAVTPPEHARYSSTMLGAAEDAASQSLINSLALLEDTYTMQDKRLKNIYDELRSLNNNITGIVRNIAMTGGVGDFGATYWSTPGMESAWWAKDISGLWGGNIFDQMNNPLGKMFSLFKYFDPLAGSISLFSKLMGDVFGGETETMQVGGGIKISGSTLGDILDQGVSARQYARYITKTDGGWFGDDSVMLWSKYKDLDASVLTTLDLVFKNMTNTLVYLAEGFGADVNKVLDYSFEELRINLLGKSGDEISKILTEQFSKIADEAAAALFGDLIRQYQQLNEGLMETAVRLITQRDVILRMLEMTGQRFDGAIPAALRFSQTLIEIAGGMDKLTDAMQTYYDAFFSDAEKQEMLKRQLTEILGGYGLDLPGTRAGYRELVESLDLTTDAGLRAYAALIELASGADQYYDYLEQRRNNLRESDYATRAEYERAVRGYAAGGIHRGGYRVVGEMGPELEFTGPSTIHSTQDSRRALGTDDLIAEVRALRQDMGEANFNIAANNNKIARLLDQWNGEGMPAERT